MAKVHSLDLLNNSISYFREAVSYAQRDNPETNHWKFAILHVVQAMELAFKERLRRVHPVLIYENVDKADKTVSLTTAITRLKNPSMGGVSISDGDRRKIEKAFDLRNQLTHFEFSQPHEHVELKFAEIFSFLIFFYRTQLGLPPSEIIEETEHARVLRLVQTRRELLERAKEYVAGLEDTTTWCCAECGEDTFVVSEEQCCLCHWRERLLECPTCGTLNFEHELVDISNEFDGYMDEGRLEIESYGMETTACPECINETRAEIEHKRWSQYHEDIAMEEYYRNKA